MKRRTFIQTSSLVSLPVLLSGMELTAISKSTLASLINGEDDKVLVLVQLNGGNDGLNTFIPLDQYDNLNKVRPSILIPESQVLTINDAQGFHTSLTGFKSLFDEEKLSVVQGVGYPNQNRSHFRSTDIWTTASDADQYITTGWLGRYFDLAHPTFPVNYPNDQFPDPFAITLGYVVSETCQGQASNFSFTINSEEELSQLEDTVTGNGDGSCFSSELSYLRDVVRQTNAYSTRVLEAFDKGNNLETYPEGNLARQLKIVANLISGGLKTKIYVVSQGGYDTHANQVVSDEVTTGSHADLLSELGNAIKAFQNDLVQLGVDEQVMGMTFSEFGRRIKANDSFGTDHGSSAPLFVFGSCVETKVFGQNAQIGETVGDDEGVAMQYDFRSVYASILMDWFKTPKEDIQKVLFKEFQHIPFVKGCENTTSTKENDSLDISLSPNPAENYLMLNLPKTNGTVNISLYDTRGSLLKTILEQKAVPGNSEIRIELHDFHEGIYFIRVADGDRVSTLKFVKE